jgi:hypothetical protein
LFYGNPEMTGAKAQDQYGAREISELIRELNP